VYEKVIQQITDKISSGEYKPGDYLPTERELSEMMDVSRASVREALRVLEYIGLIECKPKNGTNIVYVSPEILANRLHTIDLRSNKSNFENLLELRETIEPKIAGLAAQKATDEEVKLIKKYIYDLGENIEEEEFENSDALFHLYIAQASNNIFFIRIMEMLFEMLKEVRKKTVFSYHRREGIFEEHKLIYEAIENRDIEKSAMAMKQHLTNIRMALK
jgi:GntR family transcriptional repressor for pyruvate dehydrogenase complex